MSIASPAELAERIYEAVSRRKVGCRDEEVKLPERLIEDYATHVRQKMRDDLMSNSGPIKKEIAFRDAVARWTAAIAEARWWHVRVAMTAMGEDVKQECRDRMAELESCESVVRNNS